MIAWLVILYIAWFVHVPWYVYVVIATGIIIKILGFLTGIYEEGKKDGNRID